MKLVEQLAKEDDACAGERRDETNASVALPALYEQARGGERRRFVTSVPKRAFQRITAPRSIWYTLTVINRRPMFDRALATASRNYRADSWERGEQTE